MKNDHSHLTELAWYNNFKRLVDFLVSLALILLFIPILFLAALLVKSDGTGGSVLLDLPLRLGKARRLFRMYKFRTMVPQADEIYMKNERFRKLKSKHTKNRKIPLKQDPRITRVGKILRSCDIDELPQLFNVLKGDMSLVGPRPYLPNEITEIEEWGKGYSIMIHEVMSVTPGITGLWQVNGRNDIDLEGRVRLDHEYIMKRSPFLDLKILLKTPWVVVTRKGAW